jgi:hypothetical protein
MEPLLVQHLQGFFVYRGDVWGTVMHTLPFSAFYVISGRRPGDQGGKRQQIPQVQQMRDFFQFPVY